MKTWKVLSFVAVMLVSGMAMARAPEVIADLVDQKAVAASGKVLTADEVRQVVTAVATKRQWEVAPQADGKLLASLSWQNAKHTIVVEIVCAAGSYSVSYRDSVNMNYLAQNGQRTIHPYYNRFVRELRDAINVELLKQ